MQIKQHQPKSIGARLNGFVMAILLLSLFYISTSYADVFQNYCKQRGGTYICTQDGLTPKNPTFYWNGSQPTGATTSEVYT